MTLPTDREYIDKFYKITTNMELNMTEQTDSYFGQQLPLLFFLNGPEPYSLIDQLVSSSLAMIKNDDLVSHHPQNEIINRIKRRKNRKRGPGEWRKRTHYFIFNLKLKLRFQTKC